MQKLKRTPQPIAFIKSPLRCCANLFNLPSETSQQRSDIPNFLEYHQSEHYRNKRSSHADYSFFNWAVSANPP